jgi:CHAT domain-containing protein/tetratricopeptide (TPR) repeat protein
MASPALILGLVLVASTEAPAQQRDLSPWTIPSDVGPPLDQAEERRFAQAASASADIHNSGDHARAEAAGRSLLVESERVYGPNHPLTAVFARGLAETLTLLNRNGEAEPLLRWALTIYDARVGQDRAPVMTAQLCYSLSRLLIDRREAGGEAIALLERVVVLRGDDRNAFLHDNSNLITAFIIANRDEDAARVGAEMLQRAEHDFNDDPLMIARAQRLYGAVLDGASRGLEARPYFELSQQTALAYWQRANPEERERRRGEFEALLPFGFDETPERLRARALQVMSASGTGEAVDRNWRVILRAYGEAAFTAGQRDEGLRVLHEMTRRQEAADDAPVDRNTNLWLLASLLQTAERFVDAERVLQQVVTLDRQSGTYANSALYLRLLAVVNVRLGRADVAERALNDMVRVADLAGGEGSRYALQYRNLQAAVLLNANRPEAAERAARATWRAYEDRSGIPVNDRTSQFAQQAYIGDTALLFASSVWETEGKRPLSPARAREVFEAMQDQTVSASSNALAAGGARIAAGEAGLGDLAGGWLDAQEAIAALDQRILGLLDAGAAGGGERARLLELRRQEDARRAAAEAGLRARYGNFFDLLRPSRLSLADAQAAIGEDEALVVLTPGMPIVNAYATHMGFVFVVTREGAAWARVGVAPTQLADEIAQLHASLQAGGSTRAPGLGNAQGAVSGARGYDRARANRLYEALFGAPQIEALLRSKTRWTLAPEGILLSTPFAALVTQAPSGGAGGDTDPAALRATHWLGLERTLAITPSMSALRAQRGPVPANADQRISFFGLGDPAFDGQPGASRGLEMRAFFRGGSANVEAVRALPRLPGTRSEIERLAQAFGASRADYVLDVVATESELNRRNADGRLARANVIAFATHGLMAGDLSGSLAEPALALSPPGEASESDDGLLTASEAARLRLSARWVILSACNTAAGERPDAEGLSGLARAFFYAGARTLLVSQWPVNDTAAERLTTRAVELQRTENISTAEAMRRSMRELVDDRSRDGEGRSFAHPSAWASFILVSGN